MTQRENGADDIAGEADSMCETVEFAANMARVIERSQLLWARFLEQNAGENKSISPDPFNLAPVFAELGATMLSHPEEMAEAAMRYWSGQSELWRRFYLRWLGEETAPMVEPSRGDRRFRDEEWSANQVFNFVEQSYLLTSRWIMETVHGIGDMNKKDRKKVDFYTRQVVEGLAPTNFAALNPEVLRATVAENGENLVRGLDNMLGDLERGKGKLLIRQTDLDAFKIGENMALSPGQVIFQNDLLQLIQYAPATENVWKKPILFCPPWINKFYILDLNARKSMVKYLVEQGHTVFMISWVNPDGRQRDKTFESYMTEGVSVALDKVIQETGEKSVNVAGYCVGGTLMGTALAYMAAVGDTRVASCTFFAAQFDFTDAGELQILVDEKMLDMLSEDMDEKGYMAAESMAAAFNMLRASDLIWGYVVSNYMLGKSPFPFDLLYWNSDSTCMPAKVHRFYLEEYYKDNMLARGEMTFCDERLDLSMVDLPLYHVATREDHIAPSASVYRGARMMGTGKARFILAGSGHIAGVINPPASGKYQYWANDSFGDEKTLEEWLRGAKETPGSWWADWGKWLAAHSAGKVAARAPGANVGVIEPAPGSYVKVRFDER